jgi:hypothetical protein
MNNRGVALILSFILIAVLTVLGVASLSRSISESRIARRYSESTQAFWLAEAGINQAWNNLRAGFASADNIDYTVLGPGGLGPGGYSVVIGSVVGMTRTVTATGFIPSNASPRVQRVIRAVMNQYQNIPPDFYNNAIYSAGDVSIGIDCTVNGDVFSGGTITGPVNGVMTPSDPTLHNNGLPALSFAELRQKSIDQGWYNPVTNTTTYPTSFWNVVPSPANPVGIPNVVFVNGDFNIVGGNQVAKGFIVVGGDTVYNAEIGGNATIDGCIYTRGNIWLHGGGGPSRINVNGGVWAGGTITMVGNEQIDFNQAYMNAIRDGLHPNTDVRIISWQDMQNPYTLVP